jgi:hypothetical protein
VTVGRSKIDLFCMYDRHGYFVRREGVNLPVFSRRRLALDDFQQSETIAGAGNSLLIQGDL